MATGTLGVASTLVAYTNSAQNDSLAARDSNGDCSFRNVNASGYVSTGGLITAIATKTTAYSATTSDRVILCDATGGAFDVTLPAAAGAIGLELIIKKIDSSGNAVGINPNGSEQIDGTSTTLSLSTQWNSRHIACNGTAWYVLADK